MAIDTLRCPCGSTSLEVIRTERDEDNYHIRIRQCRNCKQRLATEERAIPMSSFYTRAHTHAMRNKSVYRQLTRFCAWCGERYRGGTFRKHVDTPAHTAALTTTRSPKERLGARRRAKRNYWLKRGFNLEQTT